MNLPANNKPMTGQEMEAFARKLIDGCETHDAWLSVVRFGLVTLLDNQPLLIELIFSEAVRMSGTRFGETQVNEVRRIFEELGLKLEVT